MKLAAKALGVDPPFNGLTLGMIRKEGAGKKPKLALKAAEGRHFVPVLHHMLANFFPVDTPYKQTRLDCVGSLKRIYEEIANWDDTTSPLRLGELGRTHLILYGDLGLQTAEHGVCGVSPQSTICSAIAQRRRG